MGQAFFSTIVLLSFQSLICKEQRWLLVKMAYVSLWLIPYLADPIFLITIGLLSQ